MPFWTEIIFSSLDFKSLPNHYRNLKDAKYVWVVGGLCVGSTHRRFWPLLIVPCYPPSHSWGSSSSLTAGTARRTRVRSTLKSHQTGSHGGPHVTLRFSILKSLGNGITRNKPKGFQVTGAANCYIYLLTLTSIIACFVEILLFCLYRWIIESVFLQLGTPSILSSKTAGQKDYINKLKRNKGIDRETASYLILSITTFCFIFYFASASASASGTPLPPIRSVSLKLKLGRFLTATGTCSA